METEYIVVTAIPEKRGAIPVSLHTDDYTYHPLYYSLSFAREIVSKYKDDMNIVIFKVVFRDKNLIRWRSEFGMLFRNFVNAVKNGQQVKLSEIDCPFTISIITEEELFSSKTNEDGK